MSITASPPCPPPTGRWEGGWKHGFSPRDESWKPQKHMCFRTHITIPKSWEGDVNSWEGEGNLDVFIYIHMNTNIYVRIYVCIYIHIYVCIYFLHMACCMAAASSCDFG